MNNLALWSRPVWDVEPWDRWLRDFFGPHGTPDEHTQDAGDKDGRTLREIRYGSFRRSFRLPAHVTSEAIAASYDAGVLTVRVAGAYKAPAETQAQRIAITK
ncbi:Hsp20/alpha crystallin family protein [Mycobacterium tuberculosis]